MSGAGAEGKLVKAPTGIIVPQPAHGCQCDGQGGALLGQTLWLPWSFSAFAAGELRSGHDPATGTASCLLGRELCMPMSLCRLCAHMCLLSPPGPHLGMSFFFLSF